MLIVCARQAVRDKYGPHDGAGVLAAVAALGDVLDVSGRLPHEIRDDINQHPQGLPVCLIGGYDLLPTFSMPNPTRRPARESDVDVMTDSAYGARSGSLAEVYLPSRAVSRLPDGGTPDAAGFIDLLQRAAGAPARPTPVGTFEQAAAEFDGAANMVSQAMPGLSPARFSPPDPVGMPAFGPLVGGLGRLHIALHGCDRAPGYSTLWGRNPHPPGDDVPVVHASDLRGCHLDGAVVSFSSCYSAMLDSLDGDPPRDSGNQVALACLSAGAKTVYGSTRATWIDIKAPFDSFGTALMAVIWQQLGAGKGAAEALRAAKTEYATTALQADEWTQPYVFKTLLQAHCYGHPLVSL